MRRNHITYFILILAALLVSRIAAQDTDQTAQPEQEQPPAWLQASAEDMQWWRDARFGMFVHWGPVSLKGTEISWSRADRGPRKGAGGQIPVDVYDNLYKQFNPAEYDPAKWVEIAKAAGMKYIVFTTKHHAGFCMFDSALTDYDIMNSPYGRDIVAELASACHDAGFPIGFYYSPPDWHHPDYRTDNHDAYIEYLHGQLRELCTNYGKIDIIWFDGLGGSTEDWQSEKLFRMLRQLQPHVLINNRGGLRGDYDTPEQTVGRFNRDRPWESCITIGRQWAWRPNDNIKSRKQCIRTLVRCAGGDGNLLLNVGPRPDGRIDPPQAERLREIGDWLDQYGDTIYGTRGGPFRPGTWGASTCKGNTIFVHALEWPEDHIVLPPIPHEILSCEVLTGGDAEVTETDERIEITVAPADRDPIDTIIALHIDGAATDVEPGILPSGSLAFQRPAKASNTYRNMAQHGPDKALDDDPDTRWATDYGVHEASLEVDLGRQQTIASAFISEAYDRVREFELQRMKDGQWETFASGGRIGERLVMEFDPIRARNVRLHITQAIEGPTIWEFQLFAP